MIASAGWILLTAGLAGLVTVFVGYPSLVRLRALFVRRGPRGDSIPAEFEPAPVPGAVLDRGPSVSVIVAMRNAESLLPRKIECLMALEDPGGGLEFVLASDGSTDATVQIAKAASTDPRVKVIELQQHHGKHVALNEAAARATGEILVFSDVDALLEVDSARWLARAVQQEGTGGACGRRLIGEPDAYLEAAQSGYVALDSGLKGMESRIGSITSNDGKIYAIRRALFEPIPGGVTDDLFASMSIVRQGWRFVYEGRARAWIRTPSRSSKHELSRRRRIVCRSLRGIWLQRAVLNPTRTGAYAVGLAINKLGRRLIPVMLLACGIGMALLATRHDSAKVALALGLGGLAVAAAYPWLTRLPLPGIVGRAVGVAHYFVVGCAGTLFGVVDFLMNRQVVRWDPKKAD